MSERTRKVDDGQRYFYQGGQGALPPLNFVEMLYVACGTIIRRVVAVAKCKSSVFDFCIFLKYFWDVL